MHPVTREKRTRKPPDPRHAEVKAVLVKYWATENPENPELPWGGADAGALGEFLKSNPNRPVEEIKQLLRDRLKSEDHARGEPVFMWIKYLTRYIGGPLNKFKQPKGKPDGRDKPNRADTGKTSANDATLAALERLRGVAGH